MSARARRASSLRLPAQGDTCVLRPRIPTALGASRTRRAAARDAYVGTTYERVVGIACAAFSCARECTHALCARACGSAEGTTDRRGGGGGYGTPPPPPLGGPRPRRAGLFRKRAAVLAGQPRLRRSRAKWRSTSCRPASSSAEHGS